MGRQAVRRRGIKTAKEGRRHGVNVALTILAIGVATFWGWYGYMAEPDIRLASSQDGSTFSIVDMQIDPDLHRRTHVSLAVGFTNVGLKTGFVGRADLVPLDSLAIFRDATITEIDHVPIRWHRTVLVHMHALIASDTRLDVQSVTVTPRASGIPTIDIKANQMPESLALELRATDNTGKSIQRYDNGLQGRVTLRFLAKPPS